MAEINLQFDYSMEGSFEAVYASVLDMRQFGKFHPYMTQVKVLQKTAEFTEFDIKEKVLLFGFIPNKPHYTAKAFEIEKGKHIQYTSSIKGSIDLVIDFNFKYNAETNATLINENIHIIGSFIPAKVLGGMMPKAHKILFNEMQKQLH